MYPLLFFSFVLTGRKKNEQNQAEIIQAWPNMWTYQKLCVAHARRFHNDLSDEYY